MGRTAAPGPTGRASSSGVRLRRDARIRTRAKDGPVRTYGTRPGPVRFVRSGPDPSGAAGFVPERSGIYMRLYADMS